MEDTRKEERERHDHHHFAEEGEKDGLLFLAKRFKSGLAGVLQGLKYKCEEVKMERRDRIFHQGGVSAEHGDEKGRETFDQDPDDQCVANSETAHKEHRLPDMPGPARAVIVADHGRGSLTDRDDRRFQDLPDGIDNGIYRDHDLPAIF